MYHKLIDVVLKMTEFKVFGINLFKLQQGKVILFACFVLFPSKLYLGL